MLRGRPLRRKIRYGLRRAEGRRFILMMLALLFFFSIFAVYFNKRIRPVIIEMMLSEIDNVALEYISQAVEEELQSGLKYWDIVTLEKTSDGAVSAIVTNMAAVNELQAGLARRVLEKSEYDSETAVEIPLGTILGINLASGRGPEVKIKAVLASDVDIRLKSSFSTAGINQTYHRIAVEALIRYKFFVPGQWEETDALAEVIVAETVIMGVVPESYTYFGNHDSAEEAIDDYTIIK